MTSPDPQSELYIFADKLFKVRDAAATVAADLMAEGEDYAAVAARIDAEYGTINALVGVHARPLALLLAAAAHALDPSVPIRAHDELLDRVRLLATEGAAPDAPPVAYGPPRRTPTGGA